MQHQIRCSISTDSQYTVNEKPSNFPPTYQYITQFAKVRKLSCQQSWIDPGKSFVGSKLAIEECCQVRLSINNCELLIQQTMANCNFCNYVNIYVAYYQSIHFTQVNNRHMPINDQCQCQSMINDFFVMKVTGFKRCESKMAVINVFLSYSLAELLLSVLFQCEVTTADSHTIDCAELLQLDAITYNFP